MRPCGAMVAMGAGSGQSVRWNSVFRRHHSRQARHSLYNNLASDRTGPRNRSKEQTVRARYRVEPTRQERVFVVVSPSGHVVYSGSEVESARVKGELNERFSAPELLPAPAVTSGRRERTTVFVYHAVIRRLIPVVAAALVLGGSAANAGELSWRPPGNDGPLTASSTFTAQGDGSFQPPSIMLDDVPVVPPPETYRRRGPFGVRLKWIRGGWTEDEATGANYWRLPGPRLVRADAAVCRPYWGIGQPRCAAPSVVDTSEGGWQVSGEPLPLEPRRVALDTLRSSVPVSRAAERRRSVPITLARLNRSAGGDLDLSGPPTSGGSTLEEEIQHGVRYGETYHTRMVPVRRPER
jgi:hypothetical protein